MKTTLLKKSPTTYRPQIRSRHPSHNPLRTLLTRLEFKSIVRFGSVSELPDTATNGGSRLEINTVEAITNSSNKRLMKECFTAANVPTADWGYFNRFPTNVFTMTVVGLEGEEHTLDMAQLEYPIVVKHIFGSRGTGNTLIKDVEELHSWAENKDLKKYIFEAYFTGSKEYRLHVSKDGCFYTNRKMLKSDTAPENRWYRNDSNSVWILEDNPGFEKPINWQTIVNECVNALHAVGLDIGAIDLRVQTAKDSRGRVRENPEFKVIEINSAPSFGEITQQKYLEVIPVLLQAKYSA